MDCKCKDFKCVKGCKCSVNKEEVAVLEDILTEMLNMSGMSNQRPPIDDNQCLPIDDGACPDNAIIFDRIRQCFPDIDDRDYPTPNESVIENISPPHNLFATFHRLEGEDENDQPVPKIRRESVIENICPPHNLFDTFHRLEGECENDEQVPQIGRESAIENICPPVPQKPNESVIENICPAHNSLDSFLQREAECENNEQIPEQLRQNILEAERKQRKTETIKKILQSQTGLSRKCEGITNPEEQKASTVKYPLKKREQGWTNYLCEADHGAIIPEAAMNNNEQRNNRARTMPAHGDQKVYPPQRYLV